MIAAAETPDDKYAAGQVTFNVGAKSSDVALQRQGLDLMQLTGAIVNEAKVDTPAEICVDSIGLGSGVCSAIAAKRALGLKTRIVGVVSAHATTYADSLAAGSVVASPVSTVLADGMACRVADPAALEVLAPHLDHLVQVSDTEVAEAMRMLFADTHNVAEGAGAASFAAAWQERASLKGQVVGTTLCGGNVDSATFAQVLGG